MDWGDAGLQVVAAGVQGALPQLRLRPRAAVLVRTVVDPGVRAAGRFHAPICRRLERWLAETDPHHAVLQSVSLARRSEVEFCICLLLTMMGYIPGIIYALYAIIFINHDECFHEYCRRRLR
ncbi:hypothetical protein C1H46_025925 [Malus baccata]|uniref:Uncharacterized protein n=1 Tax=Malus baccata TaxID=106549 RepID=A0A540LPW9_MALBA|nr:hypothetical protein C1H46_025925 [Malus baccata]